MTFICTFIDGLILSTDDVPHTHTGKVARAAEMRSTDGHDAVHARELNSSRGRTFVLFCSVNVLGGGGGGVVLFIM